MAEIDGKAVADMKVVELQEELVNRGLSKSGLKQQLINRLVKWVDNHEAEAAPTGSAPAAAAAAGGAGGAVDNNDGEAPAAGIDGDEDKEEEDEEEEWEDIDDDDDDDNYGNNNDEDDKEEEEEEEEESAAGEVDLKDRVPCTKLCTPPLPNKKKSSICPNRKFGVMRKKWGNREILACVEVERLLKLMGVNPNRCSRCALAGIMVGAIKITGKKEELKQVIFEGSGEVCDCKIPATLGQVLRQGDYGGDQYEEEDSDKAKIHCKPCRRATPEGEGFRHFYFAAQLCRGDPGLNSGKWMNHCRECPDYGVCLGDYRDSHCDECGEHGWKGRCYTQGCAGAEDDMDEDEDDMCVMF